MRLFRNISLYTCLKSRMTYIVMYTIFFIWTSVLIIVSIFRVDKILATKLLKETKLELIELIKPEKLLSVHSKKDIFDILSSARGNLPKCFTELKDSNISCGVHCSRDKSTAIIIPAHRREAHLKLLLNKLIPLLDHQQLCYKIFVVDQKGNGTFNKGIIMNAGVMEALSIMNFDCVMFHDVDMIPNTFNTPYECKSYPFHLSSAVNEFKYTNNYNELIGGVFTLPIEDFIQVNGYSNMYWHWGGEDDDMYARLSAIDRIPRHADPDIGVYDMIPHEKNDRKYSLLFTRTLIHSSKQRYLLDGLTSLQYKLVSKINTEQYIKFTFDIPSAPENLLHLAEDLYSLSYSFVHHY